MTKHQTLDRALLQSLGLNLVSSNIVMEEIECLNARIEVIKTGYEREKAHSAELAQRLESVQVMLSVADDQCNDSDGKLLSCQKEKRELAAKLEQAQIQFGVCSVCGYRAWKAVDAKTEECQFCALQRQAAAMREALERIAHDCQFRYEMPYQRADIALQHARAIGKWKDA